MITFNYRPKYGDAVISLTNGGASGPTDGPISEWQFDKDKTPPTEEQIQAKLAELQADYDAKKYQRDRKVAYPSIEDQLDKIYHSGIDEWKKDIKAVKDKFPKP